MQFLIYEPWREYVVKWFWIELLRMVYKLVRDVYVQYAERVRIGV